MFHVRVFMKAAGSNPREGTAVVSDLENRNSQL